MLARASSLCRTCSRQTTWRCCRPARSAADRPGGPRRPACGGRDGGRGRESLRALDAASFSISRWQRDRRVLQTLINVGELEAVKGALAGGRGVPAGRLPDRDRPPAPRGALRVRDRRSRANPVGVALLRRLGKESEIAVPVIYEYVTWGELAVPAAGGRRFGERDVRLLQAIAEQVAQAIGRAEQFGRVTRFAYEDPLAHLANRPAPARRAAGRRRLREPDPAGLRRGRSQGGQRPRGPSGGRRAAPRCGGRAQPHRVGVSPVAGGASRRRRVLCPAAGRTAGGGRALRARGQPSHSGRKAAADSVCWGAACGASTGHAASDLIAAADAALLEAKAQGPGRLRLRLAEEPGLPAGIQRDRTPRSTGRRAIDDLLPRFVALLDEQRPQGTRRPRAAGCRRFRWRARCRGLVALRRPRGRRRRTADSLRCRERARPAVGRPVVDAAADEVYPLADSRYRARSGRAERVHRGP